MVPIQSRFDEMRVAAAAAATSFRLSGTQQGGSLPTRCSPPMSNSVALKGSPVGVPF